MNISCGGRSAKELRISELTRPIFAQREPWNSGGPLSSNILWRTSEFQGRKSGLNNSRCKFTKSLTWTFAFAFQPKLVVFLMLHKEREKSTLALLLGCPPSPQISILGVLGSQTFPLFFDPFLYSDNET